MSADELTAALRERDSFKRQLGTLQGAILTALVKRIEPRLSRHPVTVVQHAGSVIARIGEAIACQFDDGDDLVEAVKQLVRERDEARAEVERQRELKDYLRTWLSSEELEGLRVKAAEHPLLWEEIHHLKAEVERLREMAHDFEAMREDRDEARAEVERLRVELIRAGSRECDIAACNCGTWHHQNPRAAYRRGAEAMREACAQWMSEREGISQWVYDDALSALPIPEEP